MPNHQTLPLQPPLAGWHGAVFRPRRHAINVTVTVRGSQDNPSGSRPRLSSKEGRVHRRTLSRAARNPLLPIRSLPVLTPSARNCRVPGRTGREKRLHTSPFSGNTGGCAAPETPAGRTRKTGFFALDARTISLNQVNILHGIPLYSVDIVTVIYYTFQRSKVTDVPEDFPSWLTRTRLSR